jgi:hypothetical protein
VAQWATASRLRGDHSVKGGFDIGTSPARASTPFQLYVQTVAPHRAAANGTNRFGYNTFTQWLRRAEPRVLVNHWLFRRRTTGASPTR